MKNKLVRLYPNPDSIWDALQADKIRQRVYPADEAAMQGITRVLKERIEDGRKLHTLTVAQIMGIGFSYETSKNAIKKLRSAGVIRLVVAHKFDPLTGTTLAGLYEIVPEFLIEESPSTRGSLLTLWIERGGSFEVYQNTLSQLRKEFPRVPVDLLSSRLQELTADTSYRLKNVARFNGSVA